MSTELSVGMPVRVIAGKYNGFEGTVAKLCDSFCSIIIIFENRQHELVLEAAALVPLEEWTAGKGETELKLRGHGSE
jgi:hypothetical protein